MIKYFDFYTSDDGVEVTLFHPNSMEKTAEYDAELREALESVKPKEGKYYLHINALGAGEYYSNNRNGDYFPEKALIEYHKTFESNANLYRGHRNKPHLGHKIYGRVVYAFYNMKMHRVELIVEFDIESAPDLRDRIDEGEHLAFSMGAKLKYDECSICGNKASKTEDYCHHLKHQMGRILSDGRKVYAINNHPRFFDISFVTIPADRTAYMFSKVASFIGEKSDKEKIADIVKIIPGGKLEGASNDPEKLIHWSQPNMPDELINELSSKNLAKVLSTLLSLRIMPPKRDFQKLILVSRGHNDLAEALDRRNMVFETSDTPTMPSDLSETPYDDILDILRGHNNYLRRAPMTKPIIAIRIMEKLADHQEGSRMEQTGFIETPTLIPENKVNEATINGVKNPLLPLAGLGSLYYGYAKLINNVKDVKGFKALILNKPWLLPILIGGASFASVKGQEALIKNAGLDPGLGVRMLAAIPATYLYSGHLENKVRKGEPISFYQNQVRKSPLLMGVVHGVLAGKALKAGDSLLKKANYEEKLSEAYLELPENKFEELYKIITGNK